MSPTTMSLKYFPSKTAFKTQLLLKQARHQQVTSAAADSSSSHNRPKVAQTLPP